MHIDKNVLCLNISKVSSGSQLAGIFKTYALKALAYLSHLKSLLTDRYGEYYLIL